MLLRASTFLVWAAVAASAFYWGLKLFVTPLRAPAESVVAQAVPPPAGDLTRLFGAEPVEPPPDAAAPAAPGMETRFQLIGVVAPRSQGAGGVALIAVDGKQPKAFRVGAAVEGDTVLQGVQSRGATLGTRGGPVQVALQLPPPPVAATGTLPPPVDGDAPQRPFTSPVARPPGPVGLPGTLPGGALAPGRMPFAVPGQPGGQPMPQAMRPPANQPDHSPGATAVPGSLESVQNPFTAVSPDTALPGVSENQRRFGRPGGADQR